MRRLFFTISLMLACPAAHAQEAQFFIKGAADYRLYNDMDVTLSGEAAGMPGSATISLDIPDTIGFAASIGFQFENWRLAFTGARHSSDMFAPSQSDAAGVYDAALYSPQTDKFRKKDISLELTREFLTQGPFTPYIAVSGGASFIKYAPAGGSGSFSNSLTLDTVAIEATRPRASILSGLEYALGDDVGIFAEAEYGRVFGVKTVLVGQVSEVLPCPPPGASFPCFAPTITVRSGFSDVQKTSLSEFGFRAGLRVQF